MVGQTNNKGNRLVNGSRRNHKKGKHSGLSSESDKKMDNSTDSESVLNDNIDNMDNRQLLGEMSKLMTSKLADAMGEMNSGIKIDQMRITFERSMKSTITSEFDYKKSFTTDIAKLTVRVISLATKDQLLHMQQHPLVSLMYRETLCLGEFQSQTMKMSKSRLML